MWLLLLVVVVVVVLLLLLLCRRYGGENMKNDDSMIDDDALQPQGSPKIPLWVLSHYPRYVPLRLRSKLPNKYEDH